jgi:hypothetical protein
VCVLLAFDIFFLFLSQFFFLICGIRREGAASNQNYICSYSLFFNLCGGTLSAAATTGLLYQPRMIGDGDCGEIGGMKIGKGNRSTRRKPAPAPLCPPQIPHD